MRRLFAPLAAAAIAFALAHCAAYSLQPPGRVSIASYYTVDTPNAWSRHGDGQREYWTVNGSALEELMLAGGIGHGDTLLGSDGAPRFRRGMTALDAREFIESNLIASGMHNVVFREFRAAPFGRLPGFRAELEFLTKPGLETDGFLVGAVHQDRLHLIFYSGARLYYYGKHKDAAERIAASVIVKN